MLKSDKSPTRINHQQKQLCQIIEIVFIDVNFNKRFFSYFTMMNEVQYVSLMVSTCYQENLGFHTLFVKTLEKTRRKQRNCAGHFSFFVKGQTILLYPTTQRRTHKPYTFAFPRHHLKNHLTERIKKKTGIKMFPLTQCLVRIRP